jgi:hypothetical protein
MDVYYYYYYSSDFLKCNGSKRKYKVWIINFYLFKFKVQNLIELDG